MPRVTEVLDYLTEPELLNWFKNNSKAKCQKISEAAMCVGTIVDQLVQDDINDGGYLVPEGDEPVMNCMKAWEKFKKDRPWFVPSIIKEGMQMELEQGGLIGHPDFPILQADRIGIVDLKCSASIRPRYWTQAAKYLDMYKARILSGFIGILRLDKTTGEYEYKEMTDSSDITYEVKVFDAYLVAFHHNVKNREIIRQQLEEELLA